VRNACALTGVCVFSALFVVLTVPGARAGSETVKSERYLERFEVAKDGDALLLPVTLNARHYCFVLDTGASKTVCDESLRSLLGPAKSRTLIRTADSSSEMVLFEVPDARVGKLPIQEVSTVGIADLTPLRMASGYDIRGILGMDFLKRYIVRIDCDQGQVSFLRAAPSTGPAAMAILAGEHELPCVMAQLPGCGGVRFIVDTGSIGSEAGSVSTQVGEGLASARQLRIIDDGMISSPSGTSKEGRVSLNVLQLGAFEHRNLLFGTQGPNILGLGYWSRYVSTFDFPRGKVYLKKAKRFDDPSWRDMSGLAIVRIDGQTTIYSVIPGSPASSAGIKNGDLLLKVDGAAAGRASLFSIRRMLCSEKKQIHLSLRRATMEYDASLALRDYRKCP
jgi:Aspartyl protease/PDZ domain